MNPTKALLAALALLPLAAACNSSDNSTVSSSGSSTPPPSASSPADDGGAYGRYGGSSGGSASATTLSLKTSKLGTYITDSSGRALYLFEKDSTNTSACTGACTSAWPPVAATSVGSGLQAGLLKQVSRSDGMKQSSYAGHPLYYYAGDSGTQTNGEGLDQFGAKWYVIDKHGKKIDDD